MIDVIFFIVMICLFCPAEKSRERFFNIPYSDDRVQERS